MSLVPSHVYNENSRIKRFIQQVVDRKIHPPRVFPAETEVEYTDRDGPVMCWDSLGLPDLDCDQKPVWISSSSLAGELIQAGPQEV